VHDSHETFEAAERCGESLHGSCRGRHLAGSGGDTGQGRADEHRRVGMTGALRFSSGPLPAGLRLSSRSGALSGRPTKTGATTVRVTARSASGSLKTRLLVQVQRKSHP